MIYLLTLNFFSVAKVEGWRAVGVENLLKWLF